MSSVNRVGFAALVAAPLLFLSCVAYPFIHNYYVHPLGRLARSIEPGQLCEQVAARFDTYASESAVSQEFQYHREETRRNLLKTEDVEPGELLFLYDLSPFDDLQLSVRCGPDRQVAEKLFIGD